MTQTTKETADQEAVEQYILNELAYSAERQTWFELNGQYAISLQSILTRKDAEIERLREAIQAISDGIYIAKHYADEALKEKE